MKYLSVCSGIEAATVAWHPLGWVPAAFCEIDSFPSAVLAHHYPEVPNLGDFTAIGASDVGTIDLLVGGTPCQDFSVAGLRAGMDGERGQLTLEFLRLLDRTRPRWVVWENVPGVLSSDGGRAFGAFLGGLAELGYGWAYRVLDAQFFGVPQRRRRVFVVGCLGDARRAAAVLFERHSLSGHPAPRRKAGAITTALTRDGLGGGGPDDNLAQGNHLVAHSSIDGEPMDTANTLDTRSKDGPRRNQLAPIIATDDVAGTLMSSGAGMERPAGMASETSFLVAHSLRAEGFDASEDGTGRGTPLVAFSCKDHGADAGEVSPTLRAMEYREGGQPNGGGQVAVAFSTKESGNGGRAAVAIQLTGDRDDPSVGVYDEVHPTIPAHPMSDRGAAVAVFGSDDARPHSSAVRRLTPRECERLQGFPDDYTLVPYRGKPAADGPRYRALGNSFAVPVVAWIGQRIQMVEDLCA